METGAVIFPNYFDFLITPAHLKVCERQVNESKDLNGKLFSDCLSGNK